MFEGRRQERKTYNVLRMKKEAREEKLREVKEKQQRMLAREKIDFDRDVQVLQQDSSANRRLKLYEKVFRQPEPEAVEPQAEPQAPEDPKKNKRSREEWELERLARDKQMQQKRKFKSLYGRKTSKGQPIMKHRINHLLSKIKESR